jgi:excisionase family DNA binding protein
MSKSRDRLLTVREAAARWGTSVHFPRRLIRERRITFVRIGRHVRIPESEVDALIERGTVEPLRRGRVA